MAVEAGLDDETAATVVLEDGVVEVREADEEVEAAAMLESDIVVEMEALVGIEDTTLTVSSEKFVTKASPFPLS